MTDAHCHLSAGDGRIREFVIGVGFLGVHPWESSEWTPGRLAELRAALTADAHLGVGEIGLDRLKAREIPPAMREAFESQLALAFEFARPCVLHGAKCWGQVVAAVRRTGERLSLPVPPCLFHGFSRSDGLLPDIRALGGFVSVGPAVLNDHAVNYRRLVRSIPPECLLIETDRTAESAAECPPLAAVARAVAEIRGVSVSEIEKLTDVNAERFCSP